MHKGLCNSNIQWLHQRREDWRGSARGTRAKPGEGSSKPREAFKPAHYDCAASSWGLYSQGLCRPSPAPTAHRHHWARGHMPTCTHAPTRAQDRRSHRVGRADKTAWIRNQVWETQAEASKNARAQRRQIPSTCSVVPHRCERTKKKKYIQDWPVWFPKHGLKTPGRTQTISGIHQVKTTFIL